MKKIHGVKSEHISPAIWVLALGFGVSIITLAVYLAEQGYSDETLFFLLAVLRYSSFLVCICSVYMLIVCIISTIRRPSLLSAAGIFLSVCSALYGAGIIIIDAVIIFITGGNG